MPGTDTPAEHPLQLGQVLYPVQDTTLIFLPPQGKAARYQRVSFGGTTESPKPVIHDALDLGPLDDIRSARAVTHFGLGKQEVVVLGKAGLSAVTLEAGKPAWKAVPGGIEHAVHVIGLDPVEPASRKLAVLAGIDPLSADASVRYSGFAVVLVDIDTGAARRFKLPPQVKGVAVAAELVRRGLSAVIMVATIADDALHVHTLAREHLAAEVKAGDVETLSLGKVADKNATVSAAVTQMRKTSSDQQLALAWADAAQSCRIALVGWKGEAKASVLAATNVDFGFAPADKPIYRLAAADLLHKGWEQLVLGYPATYGTERKVKSCAALMMFSLDEPVIVPAKPVVPPEKPVSVPAKPAALECFSRTAVANVGDQPLASYDLQIGAGLFGTCLGVQVLGGCATFKQLQEGRASVVCGFVGVNLDKSGFAPMPVDGTPAHICVAPGTDGHVLATIDTGMPRFLAFSSDLDGKSVLLGPPRFESKTGRTQILAYVQAPPYDKRTVVDRPTLGISIAKGEATGCSVSTDKSYTCTKDLTINLGIDTFSLSRAMHSSYGENFSKTDDSSVSTNVTFHKNFADADHLLIYEVSYNVWRYPVITPSTPDDSDAEPAEVIVVVPQDAVRKQNWVPAHQFGYKPRSEVGMLLSYVNQDSEGFNVKNQLFNSEDVITVTTEKDNSTLTLDQSNITTNAESKHFTVLNSVSDHASWTGSTDLFEFLPVTFGMNVGTSTTDADSRVQTTHLTLHTALTISVVSGSVSDPLYEYTIRPLVYRHAKLGCLMLTWEAHTTGVGWTHGRGHNGEDKRLTTPELRLVRPISTSADKIFNAFSRAISFKDKADGSVDVSVELFNNGTTPALDVSCGFYEGEPDLDTTGLVVPEAPTAKLATVPMDGPLMPLARRSVQLNVRPKSLPLYVTVQLSRGTTTGSSFIYWAVHPAETPLG